MTNGGIKHLERLITEMKESLEREMRQGFERVDGRFDDVTVDSAMLLRHDTRIKEHAEWLRDNELALERHRKWLERHDAAMEAIDQKLDRLSDLILKGRAGNGQTS